MSPRFWVTQYFRKTHILNNQHTILVCHPKNCQLSIGILWFRMVLQTLKMVAQSIASTSSPQRETCIRVARVFKINLTSKRLLIAFCLKNPLSQTTTLDGMSIISCQSCMSLGQSKFFHICAKPQILFCSHTHVEVFP